MKSHYYVLLKKLPGCPAGRCFVPLYSACRSKKHKHKSLKYVSGVTSVEFLKDEIESYTIPACIIKQLPLLFKYVAGNKPENYKVKIKNSKIIK